MSDIFEKLINKHITVSCAESCTGGLLAAAFTDAPGISAVFFEGAVTYANEAKERLGVKAETLQNFGAVSENTALEMAECIRKRAKSDIGLSTTGIAGPGGGTPEKPVGLVYCAVSSEKETRVYKLNLSGSRDEVRRQTVKTLLEKLEVYIDEQY